MSTTTRKEHFERLCDTGKWQLAVKEMLRPKGKANVRTYLLHVTKRQDLPRDVIRSMLVGLVKKFNRGDGATAGNDIVAHTETVFTTMDVQLEALSAFVDVYIAEMAMKLHRTTVYNSCKAFLAVVWQRTDLSFKEKARLTNDASERIAPHRLTNPFCKFLWVGAPFEAVAELHWLNVAKMRRKGFHGLPWLAQSDPNSGMNALMVLGLRLEEKEPDQDEVEICKFVCEQSPKSAFVFEYSPKVASSQVGGEEHRRAIDFFRNDELRRLISSMQDYHAAKEKPVEASIARNVRESGETLHRSALEVVQEFPREETEGFGAALEIPPTEKSKATKDPKRLPLKKREMKKRTEPKTESSVQVQVEQGPPRKMARTG